MLLRYEQVPCFAIYNAAVVPTGVCQPVEIDVSSRGGADDGTKLGGNAKPGQNVTSAPKKKTPSQGHKTPKGTCTPLTFLLIIDFAVGLISD